jgi:A/G-specific adenine glycosylase
MTYRLADLPEVHIMKKQPGGGILKESPYHPYGHHLPVDNLDLRAIASFQALILSYYRQYGRKLPWRETRDPYAILVSEIMLQQTQVERVEKKYGQFLEIFPDFSSLASAPLQKLLSAWQGMGYNRRALALKSIAAKVMDEFGGLLPSEPSVLETFPGIGRATASSICTFAWNMALPFIETNVRTVYIHFFFPCRVQVSDKELFPIVEKTMDKDEPRLWYNAVMDYSVFLKKQAGGPDSGRRSSHYRKQAPFEGSNRKVRGEIVKNLTAGRPLTLVELAGLIKTSLPILEKNLKTLEGEGFLRMIEDKFYIV